MATGDGFLKSVSDAGNQAAFLVLDTESVPDGKLLSLVKYPDGKKSGQDS